MRPVRILIADDHEIFRRGLRSLLESHPDWEVVGEAEDGLDCVEKTKQFRPDVVVIDMSMPYLDGLEATRRIRKDAPRSKILMLSYCEPSQMLANAMLAGAHAYVSKSDAARELVTALEHLLTASAKSSA